MQILIDLERLCVLYKGLDGATLMNVANIEVPRSAVAVIDAEDHDSYSRFTDYELKIMYYNMCGNQITTFNRPFLIKEVALLVKLLPVTEFNAHNAAAQVEWIAKNVYIDNMDNGQYRYAHGSAQPAAQPDLFKVAALVSVKGHVPADKRYFARDPVSRVVTALVAGNNPLIPAAHVPQPRDPNAPPRSSDAPSAPPKAGSKTGRVWAIADEQYALHSTIDKTLRNMVAVACEKEGINSSTMSVQYSKWKSTKA
jgi:hypothetical protein